MTTEASAEPETKTSESSDRHVPLPALDEKLLRLTRTGGPSYDDSRRHPRFAVTSEGRLQVQRRSQSPSEALPTQTVLLRDLSRSGLRILHGARLLPGDVGAVELVNGSRLPLRVIWCRRLDRDVFMSGCRFDGKPSIQRQNNDTLLPSAPSVEA